MGLLRNLLGLKEQTTALEENKRQFNEEMKFKKAQLEVTKGNLRKDLAGVMTMLSSGSPLLSKIQGLGIAPDYTKMDLSQMPSGGSAQIPVPTSLVSKLIDQEMKMEQAKPQEWKPPTKEEAFEFERVKHEKSDTTRRPTPIRLGSKEWYFDQINQGKIKFKDLDPAIQGWLKPPRTVPLMIDFNTLDSLATQTTKK